MKRRLALVQVNQAYGENIYLPLAVGTLWATAVRFREVTEAWDEPVFLYRKERIVDALSRLGDPLPHLVAFSCYCWNWEWNQALAAAIKQRSPRTTVVYGGVHVPDAPPDAFFDEHPYVDFLLHGEGESAFTAFLIELAGDRHWPNVPGLSCRGLTTARRFPALEELRSPYLDGVFDRILGQESRWQVLHETNRGCPFACTFCEWGAAALNKIRPLPIDRVLEEIEWFGRQRVEYIDNADANFGILQRDEAIAEAVVKAKEKYGYPEKFRTSFAKYTNTAIAERIFRIAKALHRSGQLKAVTLALQSTNESTLVVIKRKNIGLQHFARLQERYQSEGIPTYTELILGLPDETYDTFRSGLNEILDAGQHEGLFVYLCTLLPNSEMSEPGYIAAHGIQSVRMRAMLTHGTPLEDIPDEYQWTTIATRSLPHGDWRRAYMLGWIVQVLHSFGLTRWWAQQVRPARDYVSFYEDLMAVAERHPKTVLGRVVTHTAGLLKGALGGGSWNNVLPEFGEISWPPDEGGFLMIARELDRFYVEMGQIAGMPAAQRWHGPPPIPPGVERDYARQVWYGRRGAFLANLRRVAGTPEPRTPTSPAPAVLT